MTLLGADVRGLITMGLEVAIDSECDGTLASEDLLRLVSKINVDVGLLEILASLENAAAGAADVHEGMAADIAEDTTDYPAAVERLKQFAALMREAQRLIR